MRGFRPQTRLKAGTAAGALLLVAGLSLAPADRAEAQTADAETIAALGGTVLAYVVTGDEGIDRTSRAGLHGLSLVLNRRTAVEAVDPIGVDVRRDELAFFPLLYWPVTDNQQPLDDRTVDRLNKFMIHPAAGSLPERLRLLRRNRRLGAHNVIGTGGEKRNLTAGIGYLRRSDGARP